MNILTDQSSLDIDAQQVIHPESIALFTPT